MKEIKYTISYWVFVRTFVIPFYYGSDILTSSSSGSGSTRQKVTVPVQQNCRQGCRLKAFMNACGKAEQTGSQTSRHTDRQTDRQGPLSLPSHIHSLAHVSDPWLFLLGKHIIIRVGGFYEYRSCYRICGIWTQDMWNYFSMTFSVQNERKSWVLPSEYCLLCHGPPLHTWARFEDCVVTGGGVNNPSPFEITTFLKYILLVTTCWDTVVVYLLLPLLRLCPVPSSQRRWTWTGDFKCREVKTGFCRKRWTQTGSSGTLIGWKSGQTTFIPLWDRMEGAWLWTQVRGLEETSTFRIGLRLWRSTF